MRRVALLFALLLLFGPPASAASRSRTAYLKRVRSDVDHIAVKLRNLDAKTNQIAPERRAKYEELVAALWRKERLARSRIPALRQAEGEKFKKLRAAEDATLIRLEKSYQYVVNHYLR